MGEKDLMRLNVHSVITAMSKFAPASMSMCTSASSPAEQAYISGVMPYIPTQKEFNKKNMESSIWFSNLGEKINSEVQALWVHLVIHCVHPIWAQKLDSLANQISAARVEHAKAKIQIKLVCGSL